MFGVRQYLYTVVNMKIIKFHFKDGIMFACYVQDNNKNN